jgi:hypothetical protein
MEYDQDETDDGENCIVVGCSAMVMESESLAKSSQKNVGKVGRIVRMASGWCQLKLFDGGECSIRVSDLIRIHAEGNAVDSSNSEYRRPVVHSLVSSDSDNKEDETCTTQRDTSVAHRRSVSLPIRVGGESIEQSRGPQGALSKNEKKYNADKPSSDPTSEEQLHHSRIQIRPNSATRLPKSKTMRLSIVSSSDSTEDEVSEDDVKDKKRRRVFEPPRTQPPTRSAIRSIGHKVDAISFECRLGLMPISF